MSAEGSTINTKVTGSARDQCWKARDLYFVCLDTYDDDVSKCAALRESFMAVCPATWVKHFEKRRDYDRVKTQGIAIYNDKDRGTEPEWVKRLREQQKTGGK